MAVGIDTTLIVRAATDLSNGERRAGDRRGVFWQEDGRALSLCVVAEHGNATRATGVAVVADVATSPVVSRRSTSLSG